jgi:hypothetical protein
MSDEQISHFWSKLYRLEDQIRTEATWEGQQLYRTLYGYKSRVERLQAAMAASLPLARQLIAGKLAGLDLTMVWSILAAVLHDVALYYCGSALLGTAIGAGAGAIAGGVGAVPGAAIGLAAGMQLGTWLMTFLGLKMFAEGLSETVPQAFRCYWDGAQVVWGPAPGDRFDGRYPTNPASNEREAEYRFAHGHELMIVGLLIAIAFYFTHGGGDEALLNAIRASRRLGPKMADWVAKNKDILKNHPALQPKVRQRALQTEPSPEAHVPPRTRPRLAGKGASTDVVAKTENAPTSASKIFGARGPVSGREFDPARAGGPIRKLTTESVQVTHEGIDTVEQHLGRFGQDDANDFMVGRLRSIANGNLEATQYDLNFYTHELTEFERYKDLGWEVGQPADPAEAYELWNNTHTATLEDFGLKDGQLYHPDAPQ